MFNAIFATMLPLFAEKKSEWNLGQMLGAIQQTILNYGKVIVAIIGLVMVLVAVYQIAKNLISHGKGQTNWVVTFALLIVGGALMVTSGWDSIVRIARGSNNTLDSLGTGEADNASVVDVEKSSAIIGNDLIRFD